MSVNFDIDIIAFLPILNLQQSSDVDALGVVSMRQLDEADP